MIGVDTGFLKRETKTTLYMHGDLHAELRIQAARLYISMAELIIQATKHELERLTNKCVNRK